MDEVSIDNSQVDASMTSNITKEKKEKKIVSAKDVGKAKNKKQNKKSKNDRKTVQKSIPYEGIFKNGIIETDPGVVSKAYPFEDVSFTVATQQEQQRIYDNYSKMLNTFNHNVHFQLFMNNKNISKEEFIKKVTLKRRQDE